MISSIKVTWMTSSRNRWASNNWKGSRNISITIRKIVSAF